MKVDTLLKVWEALQRQEPAYLAVIQRFRAGGGYTLYEFAPDHDSACRALSNSGQRHPGFAIQCLQANDPNAAPTPRAVQPLERFVLRIGSPILLVHAPVTSYENAVGGKVTVDDSARGEVLWVANPKQNAREGRKLLDTLRSAAVLGLVACIDDSEGGPYDSYHQDGLDAIGWGESS